MLCQCRNFLSDIFACCVVHLNNQPLDCTRGTVHHELYGFAQGHGGHIETIADGVTSTGSFSQIVAEASQGTVMVDLSILFFAPMVRALIEERNPT